MMTHQTCRICDNDLETLFDVPAPLVTCFPHPGDSTRVSVPLVVMRCTDCQHVQLLNTVDPAVLYTEYWYESGINERMVRELQEIATRASYMAKLEPFESVLDIGANDGTLLQQYPSTVHRVAVEPALTFQPALRAFCDATVTDIWPQAVTQVPPNLYKVITTIAMFYDLDDPIAAADEIRRLLHPYGVWVCQFQDLEQQVRFGAWDNFVHEHVSYHTLQTFQSVVRKAGMQVVHVERTTINGGSLRVYVRHQSVDSERASVGEQLQQESRTLHGAWPTKFLRRMSRNILQLRTMIDCVDGPVDLYGASTKGNTLLQVIEHAGTFRWAWERNPRKVGRQTVTGVPIVSEEQGRADLPAALLATIWQFTDQIIEREKETLKAVPMILPLPEATWVNRWLDQE